MPATTCSWILAQVNGYAKIKAVYPRLSNRKLEEDHSREVCATMP